MAEPYSDRVPSSAGNSRKMLEIRAYAGDREAADMLAYMDRMQAGKPVAGFDAAPSDPYFDRYNPKGAHSLQRSPATPSSGRNWGSDEHYQNGGHGPTDLGTAQASGQQSALEMILAQLNGAGSEGPTLLPTPDRAAYMRPFDEAETRANDSYKRAVPELAALYAGLDKEIAAGSADFKQQAQRLQSERAGQQQQRLTEAQTSMLPSQAALVAGGEVATGAQDQQAQQVGALKAQFDAERARMGRLDQVDAQAATARDADVDTSKANSSANARNNLDSILQQIGIGRADAEAQYQNDSQSVAAKNAQLQEAYKQDQRKQAESDLQNWITMNTGLADAATTSGRSMFEQSVPELSSAYPRQYQAFTDLISAAKGKGQMGRADALRRLSEQEAGLKDGSLYGAKFSGDRIRSWIDAYYDEDERLDKDAYTALGGDPQALGFLEGGISNPKLLQLLLGGGR